MCLACIHRIRKKQNKIKQEAVMYHSPEHCYLGIIPAPIPQNTAVFILCQVCFSMHYASQTN